MNNELNHPKRCPWCGDAPDYQAYHDQVWGRPVYDSQDLFAKLCLDGQQAGLSWITILRKQAAYEEAFFGFDPERLHAIQGAEREAFIANQMTNAGIVRNRLKIESVFRNADGFIAIERSGTQFSDFIWQFVNHQVVDNCPQSMADIATDTEASKAMSKALKKAGFNFVGPTICYAFMQATGLVNDHLAFCHVRQVLDTAKN
ncbi:DNA-3-methyladenine glycosylase I [Aliidiomarina maris]|uniref:DNA-3-methyladenine glycosylase I n=1 Tax=Aliidiomarina maris TaxID=531312 RepID=A0A327WXR8_9GAMM|nr:DNA-3-methyladenine glycosylase I [Aliidiomarina maris]RAJ97014.1 DNA-3-methyladenine glycosylase I [Aliidiomarina maris]RUO24623.1 DNA-3-methyladenine glycosylase I [Aliidiomarina maris]